MILLKKYLFPRIVLDTNEGSLGNAKKRFIREYDFLIREGWMDGVQSVKKNVVAYKCSVSFLREFRFLGNDDKNHVTKKVDSFTTDLKKNRSNHTHKKIPVRCPRQNNRFTP